MNQTEMQRLEQRMAIPQVPKVDLAAQLNNRADRTLIWGYTTDRASFHVYLEGGTITRVVYGLDFTADVLTGPLLAPEAMVPNKRVFPKASDAEFCDILVSLGVRVPFTTFDEGRSEQRFYGKTLAELRVEAA